MNVGTTNLPTIAKTCAPQKPALTQETAAQTRLECIFKRRVCDLVLLDFRTLVLAQNVKNEFDARGNAELLKHTKQIILYRVMA